MSYRSKLYISTEAVGTASVSVITKPIDVSGWDKFCLQVLNQNTAIGCLDLVVQATLNETYTSASDSANQWCEVNTAIIAVNENLGPTAVTMTSAVNNVYRYLRVLAATSQTASKGTFQVIVGGQWRQ